MGKCSGLKGGGHHRRALDVQQAKSAAKKQQKEEQAKLGKRAANCKELLLKLDPHVDLYLDAAICNQFEKQKTNEGNHNHNNERATKPPQHSKPSKNKKKGGKKAAAEKLQQALDHQNEIPNKQSAKFRLPQLCRNHFRFASCKNKRCKFSHEYSIADALDNVVSGTNSTMEDSITSSTIDNDEKELATIPYLRWMPGLHSTEASSSKSKSKIRGRRFPVHPERTLSLLEQALSEGSMAIDYIAGCLENDKDVVSLGLSCRHLYQVILEGSGCPDVHRRKQLATRRMLLKRNEMVTQTKALSGSLRYAVAYVPTITKSSNTKRNKKGGGNAATANNSSTVLRPMLVFDYENPNVYEAFRITCLAKSVEKDCII